MKGIVRLIVAGRVVMESRDGDILQFEPIDGDGYRPLDLVLWADGPEILNWTQNKRVNGGVGFGRVVPAQRGGLARHRIC